jgi:hypothetical protein
MQNMVYECKVVTRDELLQRIFDDAGYVNNAAILRKVARSVVKRTGLCVQADGGHFEQ